MLEKANARKTELATYHVVQANIDELAAAFGDFEGAKERPRNAAVTRVVQTESLAELIRDANGILRNTLDPLVNLFRRSNSKFVAGYHAARVIIDRPATNASPKPPTPPTPPTP